MKNDIEFIGIKNEWNVPISQAAVAGDYFFTWGYGELVDEHDPKPGIRKVFERLRDLLSEKGLTFADVARITALMVKTEHFKLAMEVFREFFKEPHPALTCCPIISDEMIFEADLVGCASKTKRPMEFVGLRDPGGLPLSRAAMAGDFFFTRVWGDLVDLKNPEIGIRNVYAYFAELLSQRGMTFANVVKLTALASREELFARADRIHREYCREPFPVCTSFCFPSQDVVFELDLIACKSKIEFTPAEASNGLATSTLAAAGDFLFTRSFLEPVDGTNPRAGIRKAFEQLRAVLADKGLTFADVVQVHGLRSRDTHAKAYNEVYREFFSEPFPVRTSFCTLSTDLTFQADLIAYRKGLDSRR